MRTKASRTADAIGCLLKYLLLNREYCPKINKLMLREIRPGKFSAYVVLIYVSVLLAGYPASWAYVENYPDT